MEFKQRTLNEIADMICGNSPTDGKPNHFRYRSSSYLTEFFEGCNLEYTHDGSTRWGWVSDRLGEVLVVKI